ncbi:MAG TPA: glucosamine-6-phosphate deaminase [Candidatus Acidoferrum sp.]|jgi:glucosamine-6-phosphate deaminase|nr:glucosamine-6-phosphate deaminase [Candidatus Acidoferrum sp.]
MGTRRRDVQVNVLPSKTETGSAAAKHAANSLQRVLANSETVRIIAATGASQLDFLQFLTATPGIDWQRVEMFHLDEYIGLPVSHPASFRKYLMERFIRKTGIRKYHLLDGEQNAEDVVRTVGDALKSAPIDIAFVGIGENGHLAFNDPPADFETDEPYLIVELDDACRAQQVNEGWFNSIPEVPARAISMSVKQILKSQEIIAVVPGAQKALAVRACLEGEISPMAPASILRTHSNTTTYLDTESASLLTEATTRSA